MKNLFVLLLMVGTFVSLRAGRSQADSTSAREAIERLHQQDISATLSGKPDDFAQRWAEDAVRMEPAEVGKGTVYRNDQDEVKRHPDAHTLTYQPHIKDLRISGDSAIEWGYFDSSFREKPGAKPISFRGKFLRILMRQPDGSWKFSRVMWNTVDKQP